MPRVTPMKHTGDILLGLLLLVTSAAIFALWGASWWIQVRPQ